MAVLQCKSPCLWIAAVLKPMHFVFFYFLHACIHAKGICWVDNYSC